MRKGTVYFTTLAIIWSICMLKVDDTVAVQPIGQHQADPPKPILKWKNTQIKGNQLAVDAQGTIYANLGSRSTKGKIVAINPDGSTKAASIN